MLSVKIILISKKRKGATSAHLVLSSAMERERVMNKCITCKQEKDRFSREWEYQQCQACSMKGGENE